MNKVRATIFLCTAMLAVAAFASQYPSGSQSQPQQPQGGMQPQQTQPSQSNPGAQPGQPGAQQAPSAPQPGGAPSIDDQVQVLAQELSLTADQQAKVKTALQDQHTQAMGIIQDPSMPREDKVQKIHALREGTIAKVRATLTSDEQKTKFDQILAAQNSHMHQQQPQQQSQPPQPKQ